MFHDVDPDLLLSHEGVRYKDADSSILGSGGFGKVSVSPLHCLFCEFIVIRANRKVTNPLLRTFLFPMKLGVRSKTSGYFFTTHSRFAFILFCFCLGLGLGPARL